MHIDYSVKLVGFRKTDDSQTAVFPPVCSSDTTLKRAELFFGLRQPAESLRPRGRTGVGFPPELRYGLPAKNLLLVSGLWWEREKIRGRPLPAL